MGTPSSVECIEDFTDGPLSRRPDLAVPRQARDHVADQGGPPSALGLMLSDSDALQGGVGRT